MSSLRRSVAIVAILTAVAVNGVQAQRVVKKLTDQCPIGYVNTGQGSCSALGLMTYTLKPSEDKPCPSGWSTSGGGYCRRN